jgi:glycosyltransferase involved in cell wall biosynthesis
LLINEISIVMPALDEEESLPLLVSDIGKIFQNSQIEYEIIIVDDGSKIPVNSYINETNNLRVFTNTYNKGQSNALFFGINNSKFRYIATLDSDGQNPPEEIYNLITFFNENSDFDVVCGIRKNRKDNIFRSTYSRIANALIRFITKSECKDLGCSLKVFKKKIIEDIDFNGDIHRILIPLLEYRNYKLGQKEVKHLPRIYGETKYSFTRFIAVTIDALLLSLTNGFTRSTRYALGRLSFYFGALTLALFGIAIYQKTQLNIYVHKNPIFLIGITTFFAFLQLLTTSLVSFFVENLKD